MTISPVEIQIIVNGNERSVWGDYHEPLSDVIERNVSPLTKYGQWEVRDPNGVLLETHRTLDFHLSAYTCARRHEYLKPCDHRPARFFVSEIVDWRRRALEAEAALAAPAANPTATKGND